MQFMKKRIFEKIFLIIFTLSFSYAYAEAQANSTDSKGEKEYPKYIFKPIQNDELDIKDLRPYEKRRLISDLKKRLEEHAKEVERIAFKLEDLGVPKVENLLTKNFDFVGEKTYKSEKTASDKGETKDIKIVMIDTPNGAVDAKRAVLVVSYAEGGGATAFIGEYKGKYFIMTNIHVVAVKTTFKVATVSGVNVPFTSAAFIGDDRDICIMPIDTLPEGMIALPISEDIIASAKEGDGVVALGNSLAGGVVLTSQGSLLSVGPDVVELNAPIFRGNSGGPIIHLESKKVIGVSSHLRVANGELEKNTRQMENSPIKAETRFFGTRIDNVSNWTPVQTAELANIADELSTSIERYTRIRFFIERNYTSILEGSSYSELDKIAYKYANAQRGNQLGYKLATRDLYDDISKLCSLECNKLKKRKVYGYFQKEYNRYISLFSDMRDDFSGRARAVMK